MLTLLLAIVIQTKKQKVREAKYKVGKKLAKKAIGIAKSSVYKRLYQKLETKEGEKDVFKLAMATEKKTSDLGNIRCVKDDVGNELVEEMKIRERQWSYFSRLFKDERGRHSLCSEIGDQEGHLTIGYVIVLVKRR